MKIYKYILLSFLGVGSLTSCEKYLDHAPDMRTKIDNVEKVAQLVGSAYPRYNYLAMAESYSDNVIDKGAAIGHIDDPYVSYYMWEDVEGSGNNTPTQYWNGVYEGIAAANQALEAIADNNFGAEANAYKGEALVARAYGHFMLSIFFAQPYNIAGDNSSPGIPYVDAPEKVALKSYDRETVKDTYDKIRKDLEEGLPLLQGGKWKVPKYHFTSAAANAFAARFYMFTGEWDKAIAAANNVFPGGDYAGKIRPITTTIQNYSLAQQLIELTKADKDYNLLLRETYSVYQRTNSSIYSRFGYGQRKYNEMFNTPVFTGTTMHSRGISYNSGQHYSVYMYNEYFYYTNVQAGIGYPYIMQPLLTADEALINRAEAYVQKGDFGKALADINQFLSTRVQNFAIGTHGLTVEKATTSYGIDDPKKAITEAILRIKQRAFMSEGVRWMDIVRHKLPVTHVVIAPDDTESEIVLEPNDLRRVFQIPSEAQLAGVELNPR
ncbi:RagB/SusD family nutrient uptake outer membrane protein [Sphingobacterium hotanense]|uniref:RagB/SusD family nutrient uptake outer membrane protein n=1 Tax=Sphingobacterium hotanense TaxID=649196 RepID=UPI0011F0B43B|nr:RagB/SusD family nutrient uptake outer membrane protein [Sphingobacterium hotanense]